ncbi:MAG: hypothetical protein FWE97_00840 [Dehalococcoidia bacterium]|nr:hypothetical protein [Dehalococcoidia bacterium]
MIECGSIYTTFYNLEDYDPKNQLGYRHSLYGQSDELYKRLIKYIDEHGHKTHGDTYEEYPLNEVSVADESNYLMRIMIMVQKKLLEKSPKSNI